jgi:hypothetical protein
LVSEKNFELNSKPKTQRFGHRDFYFPTGWFFKLSNGFDRLYSCWLYQPTKHPFRHQMKRPGNFEHAAANFESALDTIKDDVNTNLGMGCATLQAERRNVWSILIDVEAWWLEFELLSHRSFIVRAVFHSTHSGECLLKNTKSKAAIVADVRAALLAIQKKMKAVPAKRIK